MKGFYDTSFKQKLALEKHMFAFAIPNVIEVDWIEEKVFSALHVGAKPIVLNSGAANIQDFFPCTQCAIFADHFSSVYEMSLHLKYHTWGIDFDMKAYPRFDRAYKSSVDTLPCRISEVIGPGSCPPLCTLAQREVVHEAMQRLKALHRF